jgi:outer membrane protein assembly factor BamB
VHRRALLAALGTGVAGLAGCAGRVRDRTPGADAGAAATTATGARRDTDARDAPEPTASATPRETARGEAPTPAAARAAARWDAFLPGRYTLAAPAVTAERLFIGSRTELFALRTADGERAWTADLGVLAHGFTPALVPGGVIAAARDAVGGSALSDAPGVIAAFDRDGTERWRTDGPVTAAPVVADGLMYVVTTGGERVRLRALAVADGAERWAVDVGGPRDAGLAAPVLVDGRVVAAVTRTRSDGSQFTRLVAVGAGEEGGDRAWTAATDAEAVGAPTAAGGRLYIGTDAGRVHALRGDGSRAWGVDVNGPVRVAPGIGADGPLVVAGERLVALAPDGAERWGVDVGDPRRTGLTVVDGTAYVGGERLTAVGDGGEIRWTFDLGGIAGAFGAPVHEGGTVYTGACIKRQGNDPYDHHVYALDA